jgi:hypothetical protein
MTGKRVRHVMVAFALAGLIAAMAVPAHASTDVFHARFKGQQAIAQFFRTNGCIETDVFVLGSKGLFRGAKGSPTRETNAVVEVFKGVFCTGTVISDAFGTAVIPDSAFTIDSKLSSAHLNASVRVTDFVSSASYFVHVNMTWTGTGSTSTSKSHFQDKFGGFTFMENFHGTTRDANTTGAVTRGTTTLISGNADFAAMGNFIDSTLSITR